MYDIRDSNHHTDPKGNENCRIGLSCELGYSCKSLYSVDRSFHVLTINQVDENDLVIGLVQFNQMTLKNEEIIGWLQLQKFFSFMDVGYWLGILFGYSYSLLVKGPRHFPEDDVIGYFPKTYGLSLNLYI